MVVGKRKILHKVFRNFVAFAIMKEQKNQSREGLDFSILLPQWGKVRNGLPL